MTLQQQELYAEAAELFVRLDNRLGRLLSTLVDSREDRRLLLGSSDRDWLVEEFMKADTLEELLERLQRGAADRLRSRNT